MLPSLTKQNMRYRGPIESYKMNRFSSSEVYDTIQVEKKIQRVIEKIAVLKKGIFSGDSSWSTIGLPEISTKLDLQAQQIRQIEEVL